MLPEKFLERMKGMLGDEYDSFVESFSHEKYQALRLNVLKKNSDGISAAEYLSEKKRFNLTPVSWADNGYYYDRDDFPGKHPYHEAGLYYIQEPSAMAPVSFLEPMPGERILDLCAAPGGKSTQIAAHLMGEGLLVCNEINAQRAKILSENVERMGICNAIVTNETPARLAEFFPLYFDKILVDAPCSGEGMFRKNDVACDEWSPENVSMCAERQDEILDCAAGMLRPGGRLVYSTCTFAPIENEGSVSRFIRRHPEFSIQRVNAKSKGIDGHGVKEYVDDAAENIEDTIRLWPNRLHGEGHYAAVLKKDGEVSPDYKAVSKGGVVSTVPEQELKEYRDFEKEALNIRLDGNFIKFGDNLYLVPDDMPVVKGLKVVRTGLWLGTVKKNRFEPSHALALFLSPKDVKCSYNMDSESKQASDYLNGLTFSAEGEKNWYLICVDGFSIGWGKLAGGIMKNHYPKGLRK